MTDTQIDDENSDARIVGIKEIHKTPIVESPSPGGEPTGDETMAGHVPDVASRPPSPSALQANPASQHMPPAPSIIPRVRMTNYEGFKNHYSEEESCFVIEVLEAGADIKDEIMRESLRPGRPGDRKRGFQLSAGRSGASSDEVWIQRVRIQSRFILAHLRRATGQLWGIDTPRTFYRPFMLFIQYQPKMKETLERLRATWTSEDGVGPSAGQHEVKDEPAASGGNDKGELPPHAKSRESSGDGPSGDGPPDDGGNAPADEVPQSVLDSHETFKHIECYVDFVDKHIMPLQDLFKGTWRQKVRYSDLAYLFRPGDIVYAPSKSEDTGLNNSIARSPVYQPTWKVIYTDPPIIAKEQPDDFTEEHKFYITCYYIDYDGEKYGPVHYDFSISPYAGDRDVKQLVVYPIRYFADGKGLQERLRHINQHFQFFLAQKHLYYRGWTLTTSPTGSALPDSEGNDIKHPEYVDSNVIVDFKAALQSLPSWRLSFYEVGEIEEGWYAGVDDSMPVIQWEDRRRAKRVRRTTEATQLLDNVYAEQGNTYQNVDPFLVAFRDDKTGNGYELSEDNLMLLPSRAIAYVLRQRKFVQLDSRNISQIPKQSNVFDNLKINVDHKEMVMALVHSHFRKKVNKSSQAHTLGQDVIQGKGEGLVVLLHGVPGVGKTATAEAVAQSSGRPLFVITCGDLGLTPKEVERALEEIFRLAHLWDCILLLDEADIFLAQRIRDDLKRNALVSVFLRVLEYYSGILFLTTNRVGTLDEAFKSRIHMCLYYPSLNRTQTLQIFEMNIQRIEDIEKQKLEQGQPPSADPPLQVNRETIMKFARRHYDKHDGGSGHWNGRQIRNAFQIASSLAFYDMRKAWLEQQRADPEARPGPPILSHVQFIKVAQASLKFENYMDDARGGDDQDLARIAHARADDRHVDRDPPQAPAPHQRPRYRQDKQLRQDQLWFGTPQTPGSHRRRRAFEEEPSYTEHGQGSSGEDPYDVEDDRSPGERRAPARSDRVFGDDLDYGGLNPGSGRRCRQGEGRSARLSSQVSLGGDERAAKSPDANESDSCLGMPY